MMRPTFDEQDARIRDERVAAWNETPGPRVGDFLIMPDDAALRLTHDLGDEIQTTCPRIDGGGAFFLYHGVMNYSGTLDKPLPKSAMVDTGAVREGSAWFFHHHDVKAHNGVHFKVPCRVFRYTGVAA
jgi:hypothetical protein